MQKIPAYSSSETIYIVPDVNYLRDLSEDSFIFRAIRIIMKIASSFIIP
jgi:hypothetical protein